MKNRYFLTFQARIVGAIGVRQTHIRDVKAHSLSGAIWELYENGFEHIGQIECTSIWDAQGKQLETPEKIEFEEKNLHVANTESARRRQYQRGYDDAMRGQAFGQTNEAGTMHRDLDEAYNEGWRAGREKKHGPNSYSK